MAAIKVMFLFSFLHDIGYDDRTRKSRLILLPSIVARHQLQLMVVGVLQASIASRVAYSVHLLLANKYAIFVLRV